MRCPNEKLPEWGALEAEFGLGPPLKDFGVFEGGGATPTGELDRLLAEEDDVAVGVEIGGGDSAGVHKIRTGRR